MKYYRIGFDRTGLVAKANNEYEVRKEFPQATLVNEISHKEYKEAMGKMKAWRKELRR